MSNQKPNEKYRVDLNFELSFIKLLDLEGGYVNDPDDPGGETKYGISARYNPGVDIKNLTIDGAKEIYREKYWNAAKIFLLKNPELAEKVFIFAVNPGRAKAIKNLQKAANIFGAGLDEDGLLGPITAGWVNKYRNQGALVAAYKTICNQWYIDRGKRKYIAGWLKRLEA